MKVSNQIKRQAIAGAWNQEMLSHLKDPGGNFDGAITVTPSRKKVSLKIDSQGTRHSEIYCGKIRWDVDVDVLFHVQILNEDHPDFKNNSNDIGYLRLINCDNAPRVDFDIFNKPGIRETIAIIFYESVKREYSKMHISIEYDRQHVEQMDTSIIAGNEEINKIPITSMEIYTL